MIGERHIREALGLIGVSMTPEKNKTLVLTETQKVNLMTITKPVTELELVTSAADSGGERISEHQVESFIKQEHFFTAADGVAGSPHGRLNGGQLGLLTFCVLVLANGYTVHGSSACADEKNFNPEIGQRLARQAAKNKIWELLGFELRSRLAVANIEGSGS